MIATTVIIIIVYLHLYRMRGMLIALAAETAARGTSLPMNITGDVYCKVREIYNVPICTGSDAALASLAAK